MELRIHARHMEIGEALTAYTHEQFNEKAGKYLLQTEQGQAFYLKEHGQFSVNLQITVGNKLILQSHGTSFDPYRACDEAINHLAKRLRRYKRKVRENHHANELQPQQVES